MSAHPPEIFWILTRDWWHVPPDLTRAWWWALTHAQGTKAVTFCQLLLLHNAVNLTATTQTLLAGSFAPTRVIGALESLVDEALLPRGEANAVENLILVHVSREGTWR